jgi:threonine dehydratase
MRRGACDEAIIFIGMVTLDDVSSARAAISTALIRTPLLHSPWLSNLTGADVRLKLETLQVSHSFKVRGALHALGRLVERSAGSHPRVVTASAGNHGRAVAWAAERLGLAAIVFTPRGAPRTKLEAIRRHGAQLEAIATDYEHAERLALEYAASQGAAFISPYNNDDVIAGGGTTGLEIVEDWPEVEAVLVPVGGGGLISGIAIAVGGLKPAAAVIGVEAAASCAFAAARAAGQLVTIEVKPTIADGLGGNVEPGSRTWPYIRDLVQNVVTVTEEDLINGIRGLLAEEHLVAEGAGIAAVAALVGRRVPLSGQRIAVVLSGSNIDSEHLIAVAG